MSGHGRAMGRGGAGAAVPCSSWPAGGHALSPPCRYGTSSGLGRAGETLSEGGCCRGERLPRAPMPRSAQPAPNPGSALPSPGRAGAFPHPGFWLLGTSRCPLPGQGHHTWEPQSPPHSSWKAAAAIPAPGLTCLQREGDVHPPVGPHHPPSPRLQGRDNGPLSRLLLDAVADVLCAQERGPRWVQCWPSPHAAPSSTREWSQRRGGGMKSLAWTPNPHSFQK